MTSAQPDVAQRPLSDADLARIPIVPRKSPGGLSRAAKDVYAERRRLARGGNRSFARAEKIGFGASVSVDTVGRADLELIDKGYLEPTGQRRGRQPEYLLRRGATEVYRLHLDPQLAGEREPQLAALDPQSAGDIEELRKRGGGLRPLPPRSTEESAAASPTPAEAGSAAAEDEKPPRRKMGWRFARAASGAAGTFVRDPNGTDRPPAGYFTPVDRVPAHERTPVERIGDWVDDPWTPEELDYAKARAHEVWAQLASIGGAELAESGVCDDNAEHVGKRLRFKALALCPSCWSRRHAASLKLASDVGRVALPADEHRQFRSRLLPPPARPLVPGGFA